LKLESRAGRTSEPKVGFASIKSALTAEIFLSVHKTVGFTSAVRASNSTDGAATRLCAKPHGTRERDHRISVPRAVNISTVAGLLCFMINTTAPGGTAMNTLLNILMATVLVIAVDFVYTALNKRRIYRSMGHSLAPLSDWGVRVIQDLTSSKLLAQFKLLTSDSCPKCLSTDIRRSHRRYSLEKPMSIFGLWPYRCSVCKARFRKMLGRHFRSIHALQQSVKLRNANSAN